MSSKLWSFVLFMKIVLSRKGFDSSSGGVPNPILPDGTLVPLPIPDPHSCVRYDDLKSDVLHKYGTGFSSLVTDLTKGRVGGDDGAHLDPDLLAEHYPRAQSWRPTFGQRGSALGHLKKQGVGIGDTFLFFGVFRPVECVAAQWRYIPKSLPQHILWGWMQVAEVINAGVAIEKYPWLEYHPHCQAGAHQNDLLYLATRSKGKDNSLDARVGAGVFTSVRDEYRLSDCEASKPSAWRLPRWFYPRGREPLSFHGKQERWEDTGRDCRLQSVARGQEFVLDAEQYPEAKKWARELISQAVSPR